MPAPKKYLLHDLGFHRDYGWVWNLQKSLLEQRIDGRIVDALIIVEHDHVITMGRSANYSNVLIRDLPIYEIERGGDATYHGPGQLVAYPIVSLQDRGIGIREFIQSLELVVQETLIPFGLQKIEGRLGRETGVWVEGKRKIASIGVAVSHWVTYHGVALNINTDLTNFQKINPCGFESSVMTSVSKELHTDWTDYQRVKDQFITSFENVFHYEPTARTSEGQTVSPTLPSVD